MPSSELTLKAKIPAVSKQDYKGLPGEELYDVISFDEKSQPYEWDECQISLTVSRATETDKVAFYSGMSSKCEGCGAIDPDVKEGFCAKCGTGKVKVVFQYHSLLRIFFGDKGDQRFEKECSKIPSLDSIMKRSDLIDAYYPARPVEKRGHPGRVDALIIWNGGRPDFKQDVELCLMMRFIQK